MDGLTLATGLLMALTLAGALMSVTLRNVLHAIFGLALALLGLAGLFVILNSPFVAIMEVLIYVGGITVAMIFAVMLSTVASSDLVESPRRRALAAVVALAVFGSVASLLGGEGRHRHGTGRPRRWHRVGVGVDAHTTLVDTKATLCHLLANPAEEPHKR